MRATLLRADFQRKKAPSRWDLRPFLLFIRISDDEASHQRQRQRDFEAQHYPHTVTLRLRGHELTPGRYHIAPLGPGRAGADTREVNLRPWTLSQDGSLRGDLTALGHAELQAWLTAGLKELDLTAPEGQDSGRA